ncbi:MAG: hypothetical protein U5L45_09985 [Saprospiraceae bacterium]|nr:hypothetical protein [Saprospiraceae bacterium]
MKKYFLQILAILLFTITSYSPILAQVKKEKQQNQNAKHVHIDTKDGKKN